MTDDTRLWAALVQASGGVWGGCVYDARCDPGAAERGRMMLASLALCAGSPTCFALRDGILWKLRRAVRTHVSKARLGHSLAGPGPK